MNPTNVITREPQNAEQARDVAQQAAAVLNDGGLAVVPTETVYGIAALASRSAGIERLRALKPESASRGFTIHLARPADAEQLVDWRDPALRRLVGKCLPGPITLRVPVDRSVMKEKLEALGLADHPERLYHDGLVSLRCPDHPLTRQLLEQADGPVVAGPAPGPGGRAAHDAGEAAESLEGRVDLIVDGGRTRYAQPSTVLRVHGSGFEQRVELERQGVYDERVVRRIMRSTLLMVCSGNTCRSPMAEGLARHILAGERNLPDDQLESAGFRVLSAGVSAMPGAPASPYAVSALEAAGVDIAGHRSRELTGDLVRDADLILTMTAAHRDAVLSMVPEAKEKTYTLNPDGDVPDPIGAGAEDYRHTATRIKQLLERRLKEFEL